ncbi:peroxiredoxin [Blattabacterium sp. (Cryptocercus punctulatus) str. Cpu]|uniref:peroxiredoxin n=1 Tax=Blattabacterium sp. (Cryptocercus punctulatus) str. Cpu TaxID=1075399 RepID=UPI00023870FF|nr:peroxiredoxin [Blattabacterium sp. (Cryptocercus punctulatus) str. Cpu]AEU09374.1 peroxiredoxin (thioredoxin peroxidase) [Blattabacterium sp. (Cryptocercus punctulatus) str. Cpu]
MNTLIAKKAPNFTANAVLNGKDIVPNFTLEQFKGSKYVLLFFYPKDFTFVCPTEIYAFQEKMNDFESRNVQIIAISTDTEQSHWAWLQIPKEKGGISGVTYPIVSDINKTISHNYGVLSENWICNNNEELKATGEIIAYRGLFLIDKNGIIRHLLINDFPLGRNVDEAIRMIDALQYYEKSGEVCPANWKKGEKSLEASHSGLLDYFSS